jgi:hypothetical protein
MHAFLGRQMSNGHFICPLDISNVHWIQWTIGQYPLLITNISMMLFPGSYKVRFSPLDSIDSQISNEHSICPLDPLDMHMSTTVHIDRETISQFSHFIIVKRNKIFEIAYYVNPLERYSSVLVATQRFKSL